MITYVVGQGLPRSKDGVWLSRSQILAPSGPIRSALLPSDGQEQRKILKPVGRLFCKRVEIRAAATVTEFLVILKGL